MPASSRRLLLALAVIASGCGGSGDTTTPASIGLSLGSPAVTIGAGASGTTTVTLTRTNYAGDVTFTLENAPAGVTGLFTPAALTGTGTSSTLTLSALSTAAAATTTITVRARGAGVSDQTATIALTVTPAPSFSLTLAATTASVAPGSSTTVGATLTRTNFTGDVTFSVTGLPTGATASFSPSPTTTSASTLTINGGTAAPGAYTLTVTATGGSVTRTATLALTVTGTGSPSTVTMTFCSPGAPIWVAYQSGTSGAWTRATGSANVYTFPISGVGGVAYVYSFDDNASANGYSVQILYGTAAELNTFGISSCFIGSKSVTGTITGASAGQTATVNLGGANVQTTSSSFTLPNIPDGAHDLLATLSTSTSAGTTASSMIIRRAINPTTGSVLPVLAFATEGFGLQAFTATVNALGSSGTFLTSDFNTANGSFITLTNQQVTSASVPFLTVPSSKLIAGDLHSVIAEALDGNAYRMNGQYFATPSNRTMTFGPAIGAVSFSTVATSPYPRLRLQFAAPATYSTFAEAYFEQTGGFSGSSNRTVDIIATPAYFGGLPASWSLTIPDLSAASGFSSTWMLAPATATDYVGAAYGGNFLGAPADGTVLSIGATFGSAASISLGDASASSRSLGATAAARMGWRPAIGGGSRSRGATAFIARGAGSEVR